MTKISKSVNLEMVCFEKINGIARRGFGKNFSAALNWFIYSKFDSVEFANFMAKYHCGMMNTFKDIQETQKQIKKAKQQQKQ